MLNDKELEDVRAGYSAAMTLDEPLVRLCANVNTGHSPNKQLYSVIRASARIVNETSVFCIGSYGAALKPDAEEYLLRKQFPYTLMEVDGVFENGQYNLCLWMQKTDLEQVRPNDFDNTFGSVAIDVFDRLKTWEEARAAGIPERTIQEFIMLSQRPPISRVVLSYGHASVDMQNLGLPKGYWILPPNVWNFYGEEKAPTELLELMERLTKT